jgi:hypothetical protein
MPGHLEPQRHNAHIDGGNGLSVISKKRLPALRLVRDNDRAYGHVFTSRVRAMGIRDRLIGTLRRECLDQMVIFGEAHLRRILSAYAAYYNQARTHLALQKDAPLRRAVQRSGAIVAIPILAGLHHQYVRI